MSVSSINYRIMYHLLYNMYIMYYHPPKNTSFLLETAENA